MAKKQFFAIFKSDRPEDSGLDVIIAFDKERQRKQFLQAKEGVMHVFDVRGYPPQKAQFNLQVIGAKKRLLSAREVRELDAKNTAWFWAP